MGGYLPAHELDLVTVTGLGWPLKTPFFVTKNCLFLPECGTILHLTIFVNHSLLFLLYHVCTRALTTTNRFQVSALP